MLNECKECHWWSGRIERLSNGKFYPCKNIGVDGWNHWSKHQMPPEHCTSYCKKGEYKPTGIWAVVADAAKDIEEIVECET